MSNHDKNNSGYDLVADYYDYIDCYTNRNDPSFYLEVAKESWGEILEIGCGTGRILIQTVRKGKKITGIDLSSNMLRKCQEKLQRESVNIQSNVTLIRVDIRNFRLPNTFTIVTTPFRTFQHLLTTEDQISCLHCINNHMAPGGRFIVDIYNPDITELVRGDINHELEDDTEFVIPDVRKFIRRRKFVSKDKFNQINHVELIY